MRSRWLALTIVLLGSMTAAAAEPAESIDLAGEWSLAFGDADRPPSVAEFREKLRLPGSLQTQGFGEPVSLETPWTLTLEDDGYYEDDRYAPFREPANLKTPFCLQPDRHFVGKAWYRRDVTIPDAWAGRRVELKLERVHWVSEVWVDGRGVGTRDSLSVPHVYELPIERTPGEHTLVIGVDNRLHVDVGKNAHGVTDHTQSNWNGVVGKVELRATPTSWIENVRIDPSLERTGVAVRVRLGGVGDEGSGLSINATVLTPDGEPVATASAPLADDDIAEAVIGPIEGVRAWDEFTPTLYGLRVELRREGDTIDESSHQFGFRDVGTLGTKITLNGRPLFLRGTLDCCVFPDTGFPPTDVESWRRWFGLCQQFGLNHVRFHSYCPPEAAFEAADELGVYLQPELPCWARLGYGDPLDAWVIEETRRIIEAYGNHPSFLLFACGNEPQPNGSAEQVRFLTDWIGRFKRGERRFLFSGASGWPAIEANDFHVLTDARLQQWGQGVDSPINGRPPRTDGDYGPIVERLAKPLVSHEIGQWCAFPDLDERERMRGLLKPKNYDIFASFLADKGMLDRAHDFLMASGALQDLVYKEEIEATLRTEGLAGFQLLGLTDFPGQGTAPVGVCSADLVPKPYASAERFRRYCGATAPLARLPKRVFAWGEEFAARVEVAHYGAGDLEDLDWTWKLVDGDAVIAEGRFRGRDAATGGNTAIGEIRLTLPELDQPAALELVVECGDASLENRWSVWAYPAESKGAPEGVIVADGLNESVLDELRSGGKVVVFAEPESVESDVVVGFSPIFWNTSWTQRQPPHTLGVICDPASPALAGFPNAGHSDWQWWEVVRGSRAMHLDRLPTAVEPIVEIVPDWFEPQRLALVFQTRVGAGKLLVCSAPVSDSLGDRHAARAFRESLLDYAGSERFEPATTLEAGELERLFK